MSFKTTGLALVALVVLALGLIFAIPSGLTSLGVSSFLAVALVVIIVKEVLLS